MLNGISNLSLRCDPDRQRAVVPPLVHKLSLIVALLLTRGGVEPHVVDHTVVLNVAACRTEPSSDNCWTKSYCQVWRLISKKLHFLSRSC